jgi:hypothetical protein
MKLMTFALVLMLAALTLAQPEGKKDIFGTSSCMGCHGMNAMGGLGPPIARTKVTESEFFKTVRSGKGMMPATPVDQLSDDEVKAMYAELQGKEWRPDEIPISYKVGSLLTTKNVAKIFLVVFLFSFIFAVKGWLYWLSLAGLKQLKPALRKFGYGRAFGVAFKSLVFDGLLVGSLWKKSKHLALRDVGPDALRHPDADF